MVPVAATASGASTLPVGLMSESTIGVASLDTPQIQQTKIEIRALVAEIADLSNRRITPTEFYRGMLPRVCMAMGATGAALWRIEPTGAILIEAQHSLPSELVNAQTEPSEAHLRILRCILTEGQPVLVPAGSVSVEVDRPTNPLDESLIVVPVRIDQRIDFLLEIVLRPGGGPVAQRGYLRFVAQMADLLSDYLRRAQLRKLLGEEEFVSRFQNALAVVAGGATSGVRTQALADSLVHLLDLDQAIVVQEASRFRVRAISHIDVFDPRSEVVLLAQKIAKRCKHLLEASAPNDQRQRLSTEMPGNQSDGVHFIELFPGLSLNEPIAADLARVMNAEALFALQTSAQPCIIVIAAARTAAMQAEVPSRALRVARAFGPLITPRESMLARTAQAVLNLQHRKGQSIKLSDRSIQRWAIVQRWVARVATGGLLIAASVFPVPQQVSVTAILEPAEKQLYYAPASSIVDKIHVDEGDIVRRGDPILDLVDQQLIVQIERLTGELAENQSRMANIQDTLGRHAQLPAIERDVLESQRYQLSLAATSLRDQLKLLDSQKAGLHLRARQDGQVASWDLRNRFQSRPISMGQLLVTTFQPDGIWQLRLSIPELRCGMVSQAIQSHTDGARLRFSLTSHPGEVREGRLTRMNSQAMKDAAGETVILATAKVESRTLPLKKDGAIARATIDCGQVPAIWLVLRDAVGAMAARLKMVW